MNNTTIKGQESMLKSFISLLFILLFVSNIFSQINERVLNESLGPENGTLLICGGEVKGGMTYDLWSIFLDYAGNDKARLVIIPTSWGDNSLNYDTTFFPIINKFKKRGFNHVEVLHTKDTKIADSKEFVKPIQQATAVWLTGGRQWRTTDGCLSTRTHKELMRHIASSNANP